MSKIAQSAVYDTPDMSFKRNEFRNRIINSEKKCRVVCSNEGQLYATLFIILIFSFLCAF